MLITEGELEDRDSVQETARGRGRRKKKRHRTKTTQICKGSRPSLQV